MGDPRKPRKKFSGPSHPWQKPRIEEERTLMTEYGLKNKRDLWKAGSKLALFKQQAKALIARKDEQGEKEKQLFLAKLHRIALIKEGATLDDVLSLTIKDILERRIQTLIYRKGLAKTTKQARQMIVHRHIMLNNQKVNTPSLLVNAAYDNTLNFSPGSNFADPEHPERQQKQPQKEAIKEEIKAEAQQE